MMVDTLRKVDDESEIYCLLTAYIDAARFCHKGSFLPEDVMRLPVDNIPDVTSRFYALMEALDAASRGLDDSACVVLREALHVFGTALERLRRIARQNAGRLRAAGGQAA